MKGINGQRLVTSLRRAALAPIVLMAAACGTTTGHALVAHSGASTTTAPEDPAQLVSTIETDYSLAVPSPIPACPSTAGIFPLTCLQGEDRNLGHLMAMFASEIGDLSVPQAATDLRDSLVALARSYSSARLALADAPTADQYQQEGTAFVQAHPLGAITQGVDALVAAIQSSVVAHA